MADQEIQDDRHCPVVDVDYRQDKPLFWIYQSLNEARETAPITWNTTTHGYWMINRYEEVKEAFRRPDVFSNRRVNAFDRSMTIRLIPQTLLGEEHTRLRGLLNPWFSPGGVKRLEPFCRRRAAELIDELRPRGSCDFVSEFAIRYPTDVFLHAIGLPLEDGDTFVGWVEAIFGGFFDVNAAAGEEAVASAGQYFEDAIEDRLRHPRDPDQDFVSYLLATPADREPLSREDVVTVCSTIMLAGLDTTRSSLGYIWHHLATHDDDRDRIVTDPDIRGRALEEFLRLYSLLIQDGRYVEKDIEFHGCPLRQGDMISLGIISANRDPRRFEHPDEFVPDRAPNPHVAFGLGPHRCLGMHLARQELAVVMDEWHDRIPHYRLGDATSLMERGGQLSLKSLPLDWDA